MKTKKLSLLPIVAGLTFATSLAFGAYTNDITLNVTTNAGTIPSNTLQSNVIDAGISEMAGDVVVNYSYNGISEYRVATFANDFTFFGTVDVNRTVPASGTPGGNMIIENGKTVTFKDVFTLSGGGHRFHFGSAADSTYSGRSTVVFEKGFVFKGSDQIRLSACDVIFKADTTLNNTTHSYDGASVTADGCTLTLNDLYVRKSQYKRDGENLCSMSFFATNGGTVRVKEFGVRPGDIQSGIPYNAYMYFGFGSDKAETIILEGTKSGKTFTDIVVTSQQYIVIEGMGKEDSLLSLTDLTLATLEDRVKFNDGTKIVSFKDLVVDGTILVDTTTNSGYYTYTMAIPEPSTYAMILGVLAIAFAFMRRQPRK